MEDLMKAFDLINVITPITNKFNFTIFGSLYCMLLEEWCKSNDQDIVNQIKLIADQIILVNEREGKYC